MGFFNKLFGGEGVQEEKSHQLPSNIVAEEFGEVNVCKKQEVFEVLFTILMEPQGKDAEGWQTGVAIDASASMEDIFGRGLKIEENTNIPTDILEGYHKIGWLTFFEHNGESYPILNHDAKGDLVKKGYATWTQNEVEPLARKITPYLASELDADGGTTVIYWACGDGSEIEVLGDLTAEDCETASFVGPEGVDFGGGTVLTPAVEYFVKRFEDATNGMYIFITDGELHDLEDVKAYTIKLCREIEAGKRNPVKCVLIGIGDDINIDQMEELDDLESGTNVDIWDHKIAKDMRSLVEIFAEVVSENQIIAPTARIFDSSGNIVKNFSDGLPAKVTFAMPNNSEYFELEVAGRKIRQTVIMPT